MRIHTLAVLLTLTTLALAGCGGGGSNAPAIGTGSPIPVLMQPDRLIGAHVNTGDGATIGIGPAFAGQSPAIWDLDDPDRITEVAGGTIRSGVWQGTRDGSASAAELLRFVQAFQDQEDVNTKEDLIIIRPGGPKTLRLGHGALRNEREVADEALRILNTVLPWDQRLRLGTAVDIMPIEEIPNDEIHLHFTDGQVRWPNPTPGESHSDEYLGLGGGLINADTLTILRGHAYIDRTHPSHRTDWDLLTTVLHELLHAWGIRGHVDPDQHSTSVLSPYYDPAVNPTLYVTLDGELLRISALARLPAGMRIRDLTRADFGAWETTGFHLLGAGVLGGANTESLQTGVNWRNGLPTPWAYGPQPDRRLAHLGTTATWDGTLLGFTRENGRTVRGAATLTVNLEQADGRAAFNNLESWPHRSHPGTPGMGTRWGDGDLAYTLTLWEEGILSGFDSVFAPGDDPGVVTGVFVGMAHEGAAGVLEHPDLSAAFGVRE